MNFSNLISVILLNAFISVEYSYGEKQCSSEFNPCKNVGECLMRDDDSSRVRCVCKRGFRGNLCEKC